MALVIKIAGTQGGSAQKLYKDALVNEGTLLLHDFSNRGCLNDFDVSNGATVYDLASDVSKDKLGINNTSSMNLTGGTENLELTAGKGIDFKQISVNCSLANPKGLDMGADLLDYLYDNQPRTLAIFWARKTEDGTGSMLFLASGDETSQFINFRSTSSFHIRIANGSNGATIPAVGELYQIGVEFNQAGQPVRRFVNGLYSGEGITTPTGYDTNYSTLLLGARYPNSSSGNLVFYRHMIVDLSLTDMTSEEIVAKDYNYCYGIGEYAGLPTKRPFIDAV